MKSEAPRAFTLVELLIAAAISGLVIIGIYSVLQSGIFSYGRIQSSGDVYQEAAVIFKRIESDLKNSYIYLQNDSRFTAGPNSLDFFSLIERFENGKNYIYPARIKYDLVDNVLKRICYLGMDATQADPKAAQEEAFSKVREISFQFAYLAQNSSKPYEWQDLWPQEAELHDQQKAALPLAVKITLILAQKDRHQKEIAKFSFQKIVMLSL